MATEEVVPEVPVTEVEAAAAEEAVEETTAAEEKAAKPAKEKKKAGRPPKEKKEAKPAKEKKVKEAKAKKPRVAAAHPPYAEMIMEAIVALKERTGSSSQAIGKHIHANHGANLPPNFRKLLSGNLKMTVKVKAVVRLVPSIPRRKQIQITPKL